MGPQRHRPESAVAVAAKGPRGPLSGPSFSGVARAATRDWRARRMRPPCPAPHRDAARLVPGPEGHRRGAGAAALRPRRQHPRRRPAHRRARPASSSSASASTSPSCAPTAPRSSRRSARSPQRLRMDWRLAYAGRRASAWRSSSRRTDHCLYDLLLRHRAGELACEIPLIVSNHPDLEPVARAASAIAYRVFRSRAETKRAQEAAELALLDEQRDRSGRARALHAGALAASSSSATTGASSTSTTRSCRPSAADARTTRRTSAASS